MDFQKDLNQKQYSFDPEVTYSAVQSAYVAGHVILGWMFVNYSNNFIRWLGSSLTPERFADS